MIKIRIKIRIKIMKRKAVNGYENPVVEDP